MDEESGGRTHLPDTHLLAVLARLAFTAIPVGIVVAILAPSWAVPQLLKSNNLEHFAAFYLATVAGLAALPRAPLRVLGAGFLLFALAAELMMLPFGRSLERTYLAIVADFGGVFAALAPVVVDRFRRAFSPR